MMVRHTIVLTHAFARAAAQAGMNDHELETLVDLISKDPSAGDEVRGTGGCRKLRVGGQGKGKRGGYRVITFYSGSDLPVFLITVFAKGERSDLTQSERNRLAVLTKAIVSEYRSGERWPDRKG